ncbi:MAG TPA: glycosyltransferase [Nitrospirota bacterium]|nr:glycosyltransferase [Nitrospirota bacterium]
MFRITDMANPEYSVVIPNLHSPRIGDVLEALRRQEGVDNSIYEILVVGLDKYGFVRKHEAEDKRIRFLESERQLNAAEARNRGIEAARGRLIFFIDADCIAPVYWMATLLRTYLEGHPVVGGPIWFDSGPFWILCDNVAHFHDLLPDIERGVNRHFMLPTANLMIEKAVFDKVGKFDETYPPSEDFELIMRIRKAGYDLFFEPEAKIVHKPSRDSLGAVLSHSRGWARKSIKIRSEFREILGTPWFLFQPNLLRLMSPAIAAAVTVKIFTKHRCVRRYWYTAPVIFMTKLVWCWAAAKEVAAGRHGS